MVQEVQEGVVQVTSTVCDVIPKKEGIRMNLVSVRSANSFGFNESFSNDEAVNREIRFTMIMCDGSEVWREWCVCDFYLVSLFIEIQTEITSIPTSNANSVVSISWIICIDVHSG